MHQISERAACEKGGDNSVRDPFTYLDVFQPLAPQFGGSIISSEYWCPDTQNCFDDQFGCLLRRRRIRVDADLGIFRRFIRA